MTLFGRVSSSRTGTCCVRLRLATEANLLVSVDRPTCTFVGTKPCVFLGQYNNAAELNSNLSLDIAERHESQNYYGETAWFAGHRNGQTGISNPNTSDIKNVSDAYNQLWLSIDVLLPVYVTRWSCMVELTNHLDLLPEMLCLKQSKCIKTKQGCCIF